MCNRDYLQRKQAAEIAAYEVRSHLHELKDVFLRMLTHSATHRCET